MESVNCPVCDRSIGAKDIERHVNSCLFLNSSQDDTHSRKRKESTVSPRPTKVSKPAGSCFPQNVETLKETNTRSSEARELSASLAVGNAIVSAYTSQLIIAFLHD